MRIEGCVKENVDSKRVPFPLSDLYPMFKQDPGLLLIFYYKLNISIGRCVKMNDLAFLFMIN